MCLFVLWYEDYRKNISWISTAFLKFDLSSIPSSAKIELAELVMYCIFTPTEVPVGVHYCEDDLWLELSLNIKNAPILESDPTCILRITESDYYYAFDVSNEVRGETNSDKMLSVALVAEGPTEIETSLRFCSKESPFEIKRPKLEILYLAEVADTTIPQLTWVVIAVAIVIVGITTILVIRRHRKRS